MTRSRTERVVERSGRQLNGLGTATLQERRPVDHRPRFAFPDGLRGLAALWVVFAHMSIGGHVTRLEAWLPRPLDVVLFQKGDLALPVFFVISGFVTPLMLRNTHIDVRNAFRFSARRLVRLSPPYYCAIAVAVAVSAVKGWITGAAVPAPGMRSLLAHLTYTQDLFSIPHLNGVFWTLCLEVQFYLAFALLMFVADQLERRFDLVSARLWVLVAAGAGALAWPFGWIDGPVWTGSFLPYGSTFVAGTLASLAVLQRGNARRFAIVYCAVLCVAGFYYSGSFVLAAAITAGAIIAAGTAGVMNNWFRWLWLQRLAAISYSLYLLHNMIMGGCFRLARWLVGNSRVGETVAALAVLAACLVTAWLAFELIERPAIRWSHAITLDGSV